MKSEKDAYILDGHELILRNPDAEDAERLLTYLKVTAEETRYLVKEPEEVTMTLEEERDFINRQNNSAGSCLIIGLLDGEHVGNCALVRMNRNKYKHRAMISIALYQKYTGLGIGTIMMEKLFSIAKEQGIEQVELEVVADNKRAISLYEKMGFRISGIFPDNMKYKDGTYADAYWMMKKLS